MVEIIVNFLAVVGGFSLLGSVFVLVVLWATRNREESHDPVIDKLIELGEQQREAEEMRRELCAIARTRRARRLRVGRDGAGVGETRRGALRCRASVGDGNERGDLELGDVDHERRGGRLRGLGLTGLRLLRLRGQHHLHKPLSCPKYRYSVTLSKQLCPIVS